MVSFNYEEGGVKQSPTTIGVLLDFTY